MQEKTLMIINTLLKTKFKVNINSNTLTQIIRMKNTQIKLVVVIDTGKMIF